MNEAETADWQEMLREHDLELQDRLVKGKDGKPAIEFEFQIIHDERRAKWQRILLDAIDEDAVFTTMVEFFYEQAMKKIRRCEAGEPWTDDKGTILFFTKTSDEVRNAAKRAFIFGMSDVVQKITRNLERRHRLKERGWYDHVEPQHMNMVLHHILLKCFVAPNPNL